MKRKFLYLFLFPVLLGILCCSQDKAEKGEILAKINDYHLTLKEFQDQLVAVQEYDKDFKLNKEVKREFLEELIRKEVLIQEAKRLKLDRKEKFIRAIERYWESTLIRDLMEMKGKEIEALKGERLNEKKKTRMLKEWIDDLRKKGQIEINEGLL